jgi:TrpR family trp operon transcriptional repressor
LSFRIEELYFLAEKKYVVSMSSSKKRLDASGIKRLTNTLCRIKSRREMKRFLGEILTPAELHDLVLRWELMRRLSLGISQRQIASALGISLCKITRGAKVLKNTESISRKFLAERKLL